VSSFLDHPYPSDFRRDEAGLVRVKGFPNPRKVPLLTTYEQVGDRLLDGFSTQAAGYVRFTGSIDPATLPADPQAGRDAAASVQLIDVDDASPEKGQRRLVTLYYRDNDGSYWAPHTLAFIPTFGYPLRPRTRYAFVVTSAVKAAGGAELGRSATLDATLGLPGAAVDAKATALHDAWAPALANLQAAGIEAATIAHLSVFTTNDSTEELFKVRDDVRNNFPAPTAADWKVTKPSQSPRPTDGPYDVYEGNYGPSPDYQAGNIPFQKISDGGGFAFENGAPKVQRQFDLRFALAVPDEAACPMPAAGYPVVLYAHGTGGNYRSFIGDRTAGALARQCLASMGVDQIFHGTRPGAPTGPNAEGEVQLLFFNFQNPAAARTNNRQSAIDEVQRARLFTESSTTVPAAVSKTGKEIRFDPARVMFFGHSQGGQNGPLYLAADDSARGGVLSGSGSVLSITLLEKTKPTPSVAAAVKTLLTLKPDDNDELNPLHPVISLAQSLVDPVDPIHYVGHIILDPRPGFAPKSVYQTEGVRPDFTGDSYTPPHSIEVQAVAMGLPLMTPSIHPVAEMSYGGPGPLTIPAEGVSGNLAGGLASGVLAQWQPTTGDGHFVVFDIAGATLQSALFCRNLADDPHGRIPAP
jgi:predicted esterase